MAPHPDIALSYAAVHELFQLALAAHEINRLEGVRCSLVDAPRKWGRMLAGRFFIPSARPLGLEQLPADQINEYPWPVIVHRLLKRVLRDRHSEHLHCNAWFDRASARWLKQSQAHIYVGTETCALHTMKVAKSKNMTCVLDCPGIPADFLAESTQRAASEYSLQFRQSFNSPAMIRRKRRELELADVILCCSELQRTALIESGAAADKISVVPLWVDADYWKSHGARESQESGPLRVLYVGGISLPKGVPYLLDAMKSLGARAELTLVGHVSPELKELISRHHGHKHIPYVPKDQLRQIYREHDVLVMSSLGDSFGFVAMEAMAAGLPVIVSSHSGVPLPDDSWRVPAMDSKAIAVRLEHYLTDRRSVQDDGELAAVFAREFTPQRYRKSISEIYRSLLPD